MTFPWVGFKAKQRTNALERTRAVFGRDRFTLSDYHQLNCWGTGPPDLQTHLHHYAVSRADFLTIREYPQRFKKKFKVLRACRSLLTWKSVKHRGVRLSIIEELLLESERKSDAVLTKNLAVFAVASTPPCKAFVSVDKQNGSSSLGGSGG
jgi:hypothetical protein